MDRLAAVYVRDHRWTKAKPLFRALWNQYYPLARPDPNFRFQALKFLYCYITISEAAGFQNLLQEIFVAGPHAQSINDMIREIRLWGHSGSYSLIQQFVVERAKLEFKNEDRFTALHKEASCGRETVVRLLLAQRRHKAVLQLLLKNAAENLAAQGGHKAAVLAGEGHD